ncbi:WD40 repeat-like protein [Auricularia subglabra TFB-10046 SS5]|nr:WD40 repeat-like protein [Auricularia subglabra TFB-10046 SS5]
MHNHDICTNCNNGPRNLVVCIDGTSNQYGDMNTNVVELYSRLEKNDNQLTFYNSGIGTYATPSWKSWAYYRQVISNQLDLAFALRFEKIILIAYAWLADNYRAGDRIFLFGFSRGAYQVRTLSAMIHEVGLIHKGNDDQIPFAYELYANSYDEMNFTEPDSSAPGPGDVAAPAAKPKTRTTRFKETFSRHVKVHFVGVWDTVSSVGLVRHKQLLPGTADGMHHVCYFRHALALDEKRVKFLPEYAHGGLGPDGESSGAGVVERGTLYQPHTKEVWFKGTHSDIGGGAVNNKDLNCFGPALRWMSFEADLAELRLVPAPSNWLPPTTTNSMTTIWSLVEWLPIKRLTYSDAYETTRWPHNHGTRLIKENQLIHETVFQDRTFLATQRVELDPYTAAQTLLHIFEDCKNSRIPLDETGLDQLRTLLQTAPGQQSLRDLGDAIFTPLHAMLNMCEEEKSTDGETGDRSMFSALHALRDGLAFGFSAVKLKPLSNILNAPSLMRDWAYPLPIDCGIGSINAVAYANDGSYLISGSADGKMSKRDVRTGSAIAAEISAHSDAIRCIDVSFNGEWIVTGSDDGTATIWHASSHQVRRRVRTTGTPTNPRVLAVALAPDGSHVICGLSDGKLGVWVIGEKFTDSMFDGAAPDFEDLTVRSDAEHTDAVWALAFSRDGRLLVSGSDDTTARLWTGQALQPVGSPLAGHGGPVRSVAFSPDGNLIATGSEDSTVRIWNAETQAVVHVIESPSTTRIHSVAFSPFGEHVASAASDNTIRIWEALSGRAVAQLLNGNDGGMCSVVFSPDGTRIAAGSAKGVVRIWDRVRSLVE